MISSAWTEDVLPLLREVTAFPGMTPCELSEKAQMPCHCLKGKLLVYEILERENDLLKVELNPDEAPSNWVE